MLSQNDQEQMAFAMGQQRALVIFNVVDFMTLHHRTLEAGAQHWGLVFSTEEHIGLMMRRLL